MKEKVQNISIDVNVEELLEQVETEYLLHELRRRPLLYVDIISLVQTIKEKLSLIQMIKEKQ
ncbi:hypothetical protein Q6807_001467 [Campylobacter coli]|nr:hypothetical protein [Campylobacter coli]